MILPDVNVLIYAFRSDSAAHVPVKAWLEEVGGGEAQFGISPLALGALVRIVSNPRAFKEPSTVAEGIAFCDAILARPNCTIIEPGERHWGIFKRLCLETGISGRRVTNAWYAALAIEHGCTWITYDRDFARFPGLKWEVPA